MLNFLFPAIHYSFNQSQFFILKKKAETPEQKDEIKDAFNAQISYIIACYNRFFDSL